VPLEHVAEQRVDHDGHVRVAHRSASRVATWLQSK
jgi:hypothetical protein